MGTFLQDSRYSVRTLAKSPGFVVVAVLTLTLGIGANAAIFQLIDAVRLRTLPVKDPNRPPQPEPLGQWQSQQSLFRFHFSFMAADSPATEPFSSIAVWGPARLNLATGGEVRNANAIWVSADFFRALHARRSHGGVAIRVVLRASRDHAEISPSHDEQTTSNRTLLPRISMIPDRI